MLVSFPPLFRTGLVWRPCGERLLVEAVCNAGRIRSTSTKAATRGSRTMPAEVASQARVVTKNPQQHGRHARQFSLVSRVVRSVPCRGWGPGEVRYHPRSPTCAGWPRFSQNGSVASRTLHQTQAVDSVRQTGGRSFSPPCLGRVTGRHEPVPPFHESRSAARE